jgi:hypothetical protein
MADPAPVSGDFLIQEPVSTGTNNLDLKRQQALLHEKNKSAHKTHMVLPLDIRLMSGIVVALDAGWGKEFAGNWLIEECTHRIGSVGETMLEMHKCMGWSAAPPVNTAPPKQTPSASAPVTGEVQVGQIQQINPSPGSSVAEAAREINVANPGTVTIGTEGQAQGNPQAGLPPPF